MVSLWHWRFCIVIWCWFFSFFGSLTVAFACILKVTSSVVLVLSVRVPLKALFGVGLVVRAGDLNLVACSSVISVPVRVRDQAQGYYVSCCVVSSGVPALG